MPLELEESEMADLSALLNSGIVNKIAGCFGKLEELSLADYGPVFDEVHFSVLSKEEKR